MFRILANIAPYYNESTMLKRTLYSTALLLALLATGCGDANQKPSALPQIDMNAEYPEKEICLQDVAEVSYIPLETTDESLFYGNIESVSEKGIFGVGDNKIYLFYPNGKVRHVIDRKGQGPGEYPYVHNAEVDWIREEVFVYHQPRKVMMVYSLDGSFKREFPVDFTFLDHSVHNYDANRLIVYKPNPEGGEIQGDITPYCPYILMSKEDGKVDSLSLVKDFHVSEMIKGVMLGNSALYLTASTMTRLGEDIYLNDVSLDTVYHTKENKLMPVMTRIPAVRSDESGKFFLQFMGVIPNHYYLRFQMKEMTLGDQVGAASFSTKDEDSYNALYDCRNGEIFRPIFKDNDYQGAKDYSLSFNNGDKYTAYLKLEAFDLIEALEAGELSGELKTIAEGLKEDDNPVLMVVKFKE